MILSRVLVVASVVLTTAFASYNEQQKMVDDVNKYRTAGNVPKVTMSESAQAHAQYQASINQMTHDNPVPFLQRFTNQGFQATKAAENVADTPSMDTLFASKILYDDPPHQVNIMNPDYTHFGSGAAQGSNGRWYWCQHFGYSSSEPTSADAAPGSAPAAQPAPAPSAAPAFQPAAPRPVAPAAPAPVAAAAPISPPPAPIQPPAPAPAPVQLPPPAPVAPPAPIVPVVPFAPSPLDAVQNLIGGFQAPPPQQPTILIVPPKDPQPPVINVLAPKTLPPPPCTGGECSLFKDLPTVVQPAPYPLPLTAYPDSFARPIIVQPVARAVV